VKISFQNNLESISVAEKIQHVKFQKQTVKVLIDWANTCLKACSAPFLTDFQFQKGFSLIFKRFQESFFERKPIVRTDFHCFPKTHHDFSHLKKSKVWS